MNLTSSPTGAEPPREAPGGPAASPVPVRAWALLPALMVAAFGLYVASLTPPAATLAIRVAGIDSAGQTVSLSAVVLVGGLVTIASLPLFGSLSDRTRGRFGRRRPWLVGGAGLGLAGLVLAGSVDSVTGVLIGWTLSSLGYGAALAGFLPLLSELVPERLRARTSALMGLMASLAVLLGITTGSMLVEAPLAMLALPGVCALLAVLLLAGVIRRADVPAPPVWAPYGWRDFVGSYWLRTGGDRDFAWNWISRLLFGMAMVGAQTYATYFLIDAVGLGVKEAAQQYAQATAIATPLSIACMLLSGYLSDRLGRRKAFVCTGSLVMAGALAVAAATQSVQGFLIAWLLLAFGQALYLTVDLAIAAAVVPDRASAGKAMSVYQAATVVPNIAAPVVAITVVSLSGGSNYPAFFLVLAAFAVLSAVAALFIRKVG